MQTAPKVTLNVLVACEYSQAETKEFRRLGHRAFSCDIREVHRAGNPAWHIQGDCLPFLEEGPYRFRTQDTNLHYVDHWDLVIAHPPCTYLSKTGACHMYVVEEKLADYPIELLTMYKGKLCDKNRLSLMFFAAEFFNQCLDAKARFVAVENPVPLSIAPIPRPTCYASPHWFGDPLSKKTCYWLKNLPPLVPTLIHPNPQELMAHVCTEKRSITRPALAKAVAEQWSDYILRELLPG